MTADTIFIMNKGDDADDRLYMRERRNDPGRPDPRGRSVFQYTAYGQK